MAEAILTNFKRGGGATPVSGLSSCSGNIYYGPEKPATLKVGDIFIEAPTGDVKVKDIYSSVTTVYIHTHHKREILGEKVTGTFSSTYYGITHDWESSRTITPPPGMTAELVDTEIEDEYYSFKGQATTPGTYAYSMFSSSASTGKKLTIIVTDDPQPYEATGVYVYS